MKIQKSKNKTLIIIIVIAILSLSISLSIFTYIIKTSQKETVSPPSTSIKSPPAEEENVEEVATDYISYFDNIRENMTYIPTYNKKIKSSEIQELDILKTTINNIFKGISNEDSNNAITFEEIKNYALKTFDIKDFSYYPNELYTQKYYMFAVRYYKLTKENNLYRITEISKDIIPNNAIVTKKATDTQSSLEMIPLKVTKQGNYTNVYVAKTNFYQGQNFGFYNTNNEQICYKLQYNNEKKQFDCVLSNNIVENYMEKFEIYKYIYKYENDTYKLISINS